MQTSSSASPLTPWAAAAAAARAASSSAGGAGSAAVKPTKLHELIAACSALPTHSSTGGDGEGDTDDEEFGGGAAISAWQPVMNRIHTNPWECLQKDQRQRTPLAVAVARLPPPCIVRALIEAAAATDGLDRSSSDHQRHSILTEKDSRGSTPLSIAAEHGASVGCIRALLAANPLAASIPDRSGRLPLHWSCCSGLDPSSSIEGGTTSRSMQSTASATFGSYKAPMSSNQHVTRMKKQKREIVRSLLEAYPEGARETDRFNRRPLDEAMDSRSCPDIVEMLVKAYPAAVSNDESGCTPLARAIQNGLGAEIIRILVDANPSSDRRGLPLRKALEYQASPQVISILAVDAETVANVDSMGRCSLHLALEFSAYNFSIIRILLEKAPKAATLPNKQGQTPLGLAYLHFCRTVRGVTAINREILQHSQVSQCWQTVLLLLRAATNGTIQDDEGNRSKEEKGKASGPSDEFKILHSMLRTEVSMPLVQAAMAYRPSEIMDVDNRGTSALSCAIRGPIKKGKSRIVHSLLNSNSSAARVADMNDNLRLPLAQAALRSRSIQGATLAALRDCYPDAIFVKDPVLDLYPFQLAALPQTDERSGSKDGHSLRDRYLLWGFDADDNLHQTNAIFELLRAAPGLISHDLKKRSMCTF